MGVNKGINNHYVAIIGGSVSGSEAANLLANKEIRVVVFDMNKLPYGKMEDGLPNWYINFRNRQIDEIDTKFNHPNIQFVPKTQFGVDINMEDLLENWGFSAVILAIGTRIDRELPIPSIGKFLNKEVIYQNSFIHWFNHKHEHDFFGQNYFIKDSAIVIGDGLASIDVIKIVMIELVKKKLFKIKGIQVDLFTLERVGILKVLEEYGVSFEELNLKKAKLVYNRAARDLPFIVPDDSSKESSEAAKIVSEKLLNAYVEKYLFEFIPLSILVNFTEKNNRLTSVIFQKVIIKNGIVTPIEDCFFELESQMLISSIGNIPEKFEGLEYENSFLKKKKDTDYCVYGYENVYDVGNALTSNDNIGETKNLKGIIGGVTINEHLIEDAFEKRLYVHNKRVKANVKLQINKIFDEISKLPIQPDFIRKKILGKTENIHKKMGYSSYKDWIHSNMPDRLEDILKNKRDCKCR